MIEDRLRRHNPKPYRQRQRVKAQQQKWREDDRARPSVQLDPRQPRPLWFPFPPFFLSYFQFASGSKTREFVEKKMYI